MSPSELGKEELLSGCLISTTELADDVRVSGRMTRRTGVQLNSGALV